MPSSNDFYQMHAKECGKSGEETGENTQGYRVIPEKSGGQSSDKSNKGRYLHIAETEMLPEGKMEEFVPMDSVTVYRQDMKQYIESGKCNNQDRRAFNVLVSNRRILHILQTTDT